jgi:DNA repair protein RadC
MSNLLIREMPVTDRPRERLEKNGAEALRTAELIAILLRTGTRGISAVQVAEELLARFRTLDRLAAATLQEIRQVKGIGRDKAIALKSAFTLATRMAREMQGEAPLLDTAERIAEAMREEFRMSSVETFKVLLLNTRRRLIRVEKVSDGMLDAVVVHPREVFRSAILANAAAIVIVHNHPSGDPSPSEADLKVTRDLIRAGQLLKIEVMDHIIMGRATAERTRDWASLREMGHFYS